MKAKHLIGITVFLHIHPWFCGQSFMEIAEWIKNSTPKTLEEYFGDLFDSAVESIRNGGTYGKFLDNLILKEYVRLMGFYGEMKLFGYTPMETIQEFDL